MVEAKEQSHMITSGKGNQRQSCDCQLYVVFQIGSGDLQLGTNLRKLSVLGLAVFGMWVLVNHQR